MRPSVMDREIEDSPKVFVGNLPHTVRARELGQHFARCGKIVAVDVIQDNITGRSKGYAFVEFAEFAAMDKAMDEMDNTLFEGNVLKVNRARRQAPREPRSYDNGGGGGGGGYYQRGGGGGYNGDTRNGGGDHYDRGGGGGGGYRSQGGSGGYGGGDRGGDRGEGDGGYERRGPRKPEGFRLTIKGLPEEATWTELKDFLRHAGNVTYANVQQDGTGVGEYATAEECLEAMRLLDGTELLGAKVFLFPLNFDQRTRQKFERGGGGGGAPSSSNYGGGGGYERGGGYGGGGGGGGYSRSREGGDYNGGSYSRYDNGRTGGGGYSSSGRGGGGYGGGGSSHRGGGEGYNSSSYRSGSSYGGGGGGRQGGGYDENGGGRGGGGGTGGPERRHDDGYSRPRPYQSGR